MPRVLSKTFALAVLVAVMTTSPVDYTSFLSNSVCSPLQRVAYFAMSTFDKIVGACIWPFSAMNKFMVTATDWLQSGCETLVEKSVGVSVICVRFLANTVKQFCCVALKGLGFAVETLCRITGLCSDG